MKERSLSRLVLVIASLATVLSLLILPSALPASALADDSAGQLNTLRLIVFSRPVPLIVGEAKGFFADERINLDTTMTRSSVEQIRGIMAGKWDIAHTSPDNVIAYVEAEGVDLASFAGVDHGLTISLFAQPEIKSVEELKDKTLGVDALATGFAFILRKMLLVNGLDLNNNDYELAAVGGTAQRYQALKDGKIAAALLTPPWDDQARREGFTQLMTTREIMDTYLSVVWAGRRSWAAANEDKLVRFLRAYKKSVDWAYDPSNRQEAIALLAKDQKISEEIAAQRFDQEMNAVTGVIPQAKLDLKGLENVIKLRAEMGFLKEPLPSAEKYYDLTYYNRAISVSPDQQPVTVKANLSTEGNVTVVDISITNNTSKGLGGFEITGLMPNSGKLIEVSPLQYMFDGSAVKWIQPSILPAGQTMVGYQYKIENAKGTLAASVKYWGTSTGVATSRPMTVSSGSGQ